MFWICNHMFPYNFDNHSTIADPGGLNKELCYDCFYNASGSNTSAGPKWQLDSLVYAEFIDAVSQVAASAINHDNKLDLVKRIRMAFNIVGGRYRRT